MKRHIHYLHDYYRGEWWAFEWLDAGTINYLAVKDTEQELLDCLKERFPNATISRSYEVE